MRRGGSPVYGSFFGQSSFASHALAYESNLVVVGDHVDLERRRAAGLRRADRRRRRAQRPSARDRRRRWPCSAPARVGLSAVMAAKAAGVGTIIAVDPVAGRRRIAAELGATATVDPASDDVVDAIRQLTGAGATHALDTTAIGGGHQPGHRRRWPGAGMLALVGVGTPEVAIDVTERHRRRQDDPRRHRRRRGRRRSSCRELLELHAEGRLPLEKLIRTYDFDDIDAAVADAASGVDDQARARHVTEPDRPRTRTAPASRMGGRRRRAGGRFLGEDQPLPQSVFHCCW